MPATQYYQWCIKRSLAETTMVNKRSSFISDMGKHPVTKAALDLPVTKMMLWSVPDDQWEEFIKGFNIYD